MPFDVKGYEASTLADHLAMVGIMPVPMAVLAAHKAEQVRKHPGSVLNKPWPYFLVSALIFCPAAISYIIAAKPSLLDLLMTTVLGGVLIIMGAGLSVVMAMFFCDAFKIKILDKAVWHETRWCYQDIPQPIEDIIDRLGWPGTIYYGELIQHETILDPYVVVRIGTEEACLGIWDGDRIIAIAELH